MGLNLGVRQQPPRRDLHDGRRVFLPTSTTRRQDSPQAPTTRPLARSHKQNGRPTSIERTAIAARALPFGAGGSGRVREAGRQHEECTPRAVFNPPDSEPSVLTPLCSPAACLCPRQHGCTAYDGDTRRPTRARAKDKPGVHAPQGERLQHRLAAGNRLGRPGAALRVHLNGRFVKQKLRSHVHPAYMCIISGQWAHHRTRADTKQDDMDRRHLNSHICVPHPDQLEHHYFGQSRHGIGRGAELEGASLYTYIHRSAV